MRTREIVAQTRLKVSEAARLDAQCERIGLKRAAYIRQVLLRDIEKEEQKQKNAAARRSAQRLGGKG
jgi:hypothetical protein